MRHIWIRNYGCISQCVEQTADRVHGMADPAFGPAVVQHGHLLVGTAGAQAATTSRAADADAAAATAAATAADADAAAVAIAAAAAAAVAAVRAFRVPVPGRAATAARQTTAQNVAAVATAAATGHETGGRAGRWMIVVVRAVAVASRRSAQVGAGRVGESGAPITGTARAAGRVTGPGVAAAVTTPGQAARGRRR